MPFLFALVGASVGAWATFAYMQSEKVLLEQKNRQLRRELRQTRREYLNDLLAEFEKSNEI